MELTLSNIKAAIGSKYANKEACVELAEKIRVHQMGLVPKRLINDRRPQEPEEIKDYRAKIYVPKTKNPISKVIHSLEKIRRSQDWNVQYDEEAKKGIIFKGEDLRSYCEENYPGFTSLTNWAFSELLKNYLVDPNGIIAIVPEKMEVESNTDYIKPVARFFESGQICDYVEGEYAVLESKDKSWRTDSNGQKKITNGKIYYVVTDLAVARYDTYGNGALEVYEHNISKLPAFKIGGLIRERINNDTIYESRISGMVPDLDEAAREYSDLQAEVVQHIHSEKYIYTNGECPDCHGVGKVKTGVDKDGKPIWDTCKKCGGSGQYVNASPYGQYLISGAKAGELQLPAPPIGYIQKSTDIAKLQDERVKQHIYDALAAVNMEFLAESPIAQSGTAKAYDKDELNNFVNAIAEDIVRILDRVYYFICEYRYNTIIPSEEARMAMLPKINVPTRYDLLNTSAIMAELTAARTANVNPLILKQLEIDYARKQFCVQPEIGDLVAETFDLDPLFGIKEEDKMVMLQNNGIKQRDYIISCNIYAFVQRAVVENRDFYSRDLKAKRAILDKYAEEIEKEAEEAAKAAALSAFSQIDEEEEEEENNNE